MTDLSTLVDAVAADVWEAQKGAPWTDQPPATQDAAHEAVLPFVAATARHLNRAQAERRAALDALSWEMCPQDGKRLRDELVELTIEETP